MPGGETHLSFEKDPVIEAYKRDVDRTLLRENLKLTVEERFKQFESFMEYFYVLRITRAESLAKHERTPINLEA
jgi:hypothetical protein